MFARHLLLRSQMRAEYKKAKITSKLEKLKDPKTAAVDNAASYEKCFEGSIVFPLSYQDTCKILKNTSVWEDSFSFIKLKFDGKEIKKGLTSVAQAPGEDVGVYEIEVYKESDSETILIIYYKGPKTKGAENLHWKDMQIKFSVKDDGKNGTLFQQIIAGNEKDPSKSSEDADKLVKETMGSMLTRFLHIMLNPNYFEEEKNITVMSVSKNISKASVTLPINPRILKNLLTDFKNFGENVYTHFSYDETKKTLCFNSKRGVFIFTMKEIEDGLLFKGVAEGWRSKDSVTDNLKKFLLNRASFNELSVEFKWFNVAEDKTDCTVTIVNNQGKVMEAINLNHMIAAAFDKMAKDMMHCLFETALIHIENNPKESVALVNEMELACK